VTTSIVFGPVPSRRLGLSLGINNVPDKTCSYSCAYCQVGLTYPRVVEPGQFYEPNQIIVAVTKHLEHREGPEIDFVTFVPNGEPTLDINLGRTIQRLKSLGHKTAVVTNSSSIWRRSVRDALNDADWVSVKIDTVDRKVWKKINHPHPALQLDQILQGIRDFAHSYSGYLTTETMLVSPFNNGKQQLTEVAEFITSIDPKIAYLTVPIRPPAMAWVSCPDQEELRKSLSFFSEQFDRTILLDSETVGTFGQAGDPIAALLAILAVHPMCEEAMSDFMERFEFDRDQLQTLVDRGLMVIEKYRDTTYYTKHRSQGA